MTTGRINQVAADTGPSTLAAPGQGRRLAAAVAGPHGWRSTSLSWQTVVCTAHSFAIVRHHGAAPDCPEEAAMLWPTPSARRRASAAPVLGGPKGPAPGLPRALRHARSSGARTIGCGWLSEWGEGWNQPRTRTIPFCQLQRVGPKTFFFYKVLTLGPLVRTHTPREWRTGGSGTQPQAACLDSLAS